MKKVILIHLFLFCLCTTVYANQTLLSKLRQVQNTNFSKGAYSLIFYGNDYISGSQFKVFGHDSRLYTVSGSKHETSFNLNDYTWYDVELSAMYDDNLEVKTYENALRYPFNGKSRPGLSFDGDGRGCNELEGRFTILELERDTQGNLTKFAANFEQHCEKSVSSADFGAIRFNSSLPVVSNPAVKLDRIVVVPLVKLGNNEFHSLVLEQTEINPSQFKVVTDLAAQPNKNNYDIPAGFEAEEKRFIIPSVIQISGDGSPSEYEMRFLENPREIKIGDVFTLDKMELIR